MSPTSGSITHLIAKANSRAPFYGGSAFRPRVLRLQLHDLAVEYLCVHNARKHMSGRHPVKIPEHPQAKRKHGVAHQRNTYFSQNRYKGSSSKLSQQKGNRNSRAMHFAHGAKKIMSDSNVRHPCRRLADPRTSPLRADAHQCHGMSPCSDGASGLHVGAQQLK